jgi:Skp family chaperone for outer membrane proteins
VTERKPYSRGDYNRALIANALLDPFTVALVAAMLVAGVLLGTLVYLGPAAAAVYIGSAVRTYFDEEAAQKVLERERKRRGEALESGRKLLDPKTLAPPIARLIQEARTREQRVAEAIERSELPYEEVTAEVESFLAAMDVTARRAQALYEALADTPPVEIQKRLAAVREGGLVETKELAAALDVQLSTMQRTERQLQRFYVEMERILVELETVRGQVVSMSAAADRSSQEQLAADVRGLRERMGAVSEGMAEAYEGEAGT